MVEGCIAPAEIREGDLLAYLEGAAADRVAAHVAGCQACAAEAVALRLADSLLHRALNQADCLVDQQASVCQPARESTVSRSSQNGRPRPGYPNRAWQPLGLVLALTLILLVLPLGFYVVNRQLPRATPEGVRESVTSMAVTVEETAAIIRKAATKVTRREEPEVEQNILETLPAGPVIVEEMVEIVPPRSLRQKIEKEFQGQTKELSVYSPANSKTSEPERQVIDTEDLTYAIWTAHQNGQTALYFVHSADGGQSWSDNVQINRGVDRVYSPSMAVDTENSNLYVVWRSGYHANANMYLARSVDEGQTWSKRVRVEGAIGRIFKPNLAVDDSGSLYVTWQNREQYNFSIYFIQSKDGGETWSNKMRVARVGG